MGFYDAVPKDRMTVVLSYFELQAMGIWFLGLMFEAGLPQSPAWQ